MRPFQYFLVVLLITATATLTSAQKFGYVNSGQLLSELNDVTAANASLEAFQKQMMTKGQTMLKDLETSYQAYMTEANGGGLSKNEMQVKETALQQKRDALSKYEMEVQNKVIAKREALFGPILNKVDVVIQAIGKEKGYQFIFDTSGGQVLFAEEADDVTALVQAMLNE